MNMNMNMNMNMDIRVGEKSAISAPIVAKNPARVAKVAHGCPDSKTYFGFALGLKTSWNFEFPSPY